MKNVKGKERTLVQSDVEMLRHLVSLLSRWASNQTLNDDNECESKSRRGG